MCIGFTSRDIGYLAIDNVYHLTHKWDLEPYKRMQMPPLTVLGLYEGGIISNLLTKNLLNWSSFVLFIVSAFASKIRHTVDTHWQIWAYPIYSMPWTMAFLYTPLLGDDIFHLAFQYFKVNKKTNLAVPPYFY